MIKRMFFFIAGVCFILNSSYAQQPLNKIPYTLFDDFETGELFGWEPYPYAEDIGSYRLFFGQKSPTYQNSQYAVATLVRANDAVELYHGFTKRLDMWTLPETRVRAAVYFQSDRNPAMLEISLGTFGGKRYLDTINNPPANNWIEIDIPIDLFRCDGHPLGANEHIQVVTVKGTYPLVYWLNTYTILMDNFTINGERERHFIGAAPVSTDFNMFGVSVLNKHFLYGDNIELSGMPEGNIALSRVRGTLIDGKGNILRDKIPFKQQNGIWANKEIYKIKNGDETGQWEIRLVGQAMDGSEVRSGFRFLMPGNPVAGHPRLFFSEEELKSKLANQKSLVAKKILNQALAKTEFMNVNIDSIEERPDNTGENLVGGPYGKYTDGFGAASAWLSPMQALGNVIQEGSFRYAFIKDTIAGEKAKKALLKLCSFSKWNNNWMLQRKFWSYYPVGYVLTPVAYGYDMLYNLLDERERKLVRSAIMEKGIKLFYRDMVEMNRMPSNITNHIAVLVSGCLLAATTIYGDDPDYGNMEPYLSGIITKAKTFIDRTYYEDGSYVEPKTGYMNMATRAIVELLATLERNFGLDYSTTTNVRNFYKYPLMAIDSNRTMQDFGDGNSTFKGFNEIHSEWFVHRTANPFLYQYIKPFWEAGNGGYFGYLWFRDDIVPVSREALPTSKFFSAQGMVMRSGWDQKSTIISSHVGPHGNHAHFDQGSFQIMTNGDQLLTDAGIGAGGYYKNLEYVVYNIQSIAHNVMLIDHDPESQEPADFNNGIAALRVWPRIVHSFTGEIADAMESDLACVYKNKLEEYTRTLLYTKTGPVFLFDKIKSKSPAGHSYNWVFHAPQKGELNALPNYTGWFDKKDAGSESSKVKSGRNENNESTFSYSGGRLMINMANARLTMDVISPDIQSTSINDKPTESYIILNSRPNLTDTRFLAVILPEAKPANDDYATRPITTKLSVSGWIGAQVERPGAVDIGFFRADTKNNKDSVAGFITDAEKFTASFNGSGRLLKTYFEGRSFSGNGIYIQSDQSLECAISLEKEMETKLEINAAVPVELVISHPGRPSGVFLNKSEIKGWRYDQKSRLVTIKIQAGRHDILIK